MERLHNGYTLELPEGSFPLSTDSMVLAHFIKLPSAATVLDLGSGCGTLGLLLCAQNDTCTVTGIEIDETAHLTALENIRRNGLSRLESIHADLRRTDVLLQSGSFRICVSNPPYFSGGPASQSTPIARRDDCCSMTDLFAAASWALRYGGDFYLVQKPERLAQLCGCAVRSGLEPKRLRLVRHREDGPISLIVLQCRKGGRPGLQIDETSLFHADGRPTLYHSEVYHL